jgi:hypothetical protein
MKRLLAACAFALLPLVCHSEPGAEPDKLARLQQQLDEQGARLDELRSLVAAQQGLLTTLREALDDAKLDAMRGTGAPTAGAPTTDAPPVPASAQTAAPSPAHPVGEAPQRETRAPEVAQIFAEPTVLTHSRDLVIEPSFQNSYWSSDRVALVGYTVIPAVLIGLVDVRRVKTTNSVGSLTARLGLGNRFEIEARAPWVSTSVDTVSREILTGSSQDAVFRSSGHGLGDVDATLRYQINKGDYSKPFYIAWLRYRWRSGKDPFEVVTDCTTRCVGNTTGTGLPLEMPTGSGFDAAQAGVTWLYASDPAVFFGGVNYLANISRPNLSRTLRNGDQESLGRISPGDIFGFNLGMGIALNEKASFSIGYDESIVETTQQNGVEVPGSVRTTLANLLLGVSYRYNPTSTLNLSLGVGVTRDTPDVSLTLRTPITF